ncbi:MAG: hypothetical protein QOE33_2209 [Acidobacteriota bacterium]|nr:hypothetical protein [Acidobacteriota bacterium]
MAASIENYVPQIARREVATRIAVCAWALACVGAWAFVGLIFAAPVLEAHGAGVGAWAIYHLFAPLCHQLPERSFYVGGHPLAVCARCAGVYVGYAVCLALYPLARNLRRTDTPRRAWLVAASLPCVADFLVNFTGLWYNTHASRAVTGALFGASAVFYTLPGLVEIAQGIGRSRAAARDAKEQAGDDAGRRVVVAC